MNLAITLAGKFLSFISVSLNFGNGSTWPGHIALNLNDNFIKDSLINSDVKVIVVIGTNGKTTTSKLIQTILENDNKRVFVNSSGANLLNGIASSIVLNSSITGKLNYDFAIFEVDENSFPLLTKHINPDFIIALNLFRDQLDRYGELDAIVSKWKEAIKRLDTEILLNADDPQIAYLGNDIKSKAHYFGLNEKQFNTKLKQHASDSILCPRCGSRLFYDAYYFSHLGNWKCPKCGLKRPTLSIEKYKYYPLLGTYAVYDTLAAVLLAKLLKISDKNIEESLKRFKPAFGRQEKLNFHGKSVQLFLSKNPTSFNECLRTINKIKAKDLLIVLNDRIPDGRDISWIWDIDFETLIDKNTNLYICGDRVYDLALRIRYADLNPKKENIFIKLKDAIEFSISNLKDKETLYVLPTYSAMLETRKILTGKKIL